MKVYFVSGLGANKRAFSFLDLSFCEPVFIDWITPERNETLAQYALRLRTLIPENAPHIVGVSFGGMLVTEMAKQDKQVKGIIISSNITYTQLPLHLLMWKHLPVYKWVPHSIIKLSGKLSKYTIGPKGKLQKQTFSLILKESDSAFTVWAVHAILTWNNVETPENIIHIHGTSDNLLMYRLVKPDYTIKGGRHLMIMDNAAELSVLLKKLITGV